MQKLGLVSTAAKKGQRPTPARPHARARRRCGAASASAARARKKRRRVRARHQIARGQNPHIHRSGKTAK